MLALIKSERSSWLFDILFLGVLLGTIYTAWMGSYALFTPDEGRYSEIAREMQLTGDYITPHLNGVAFFDKPVLHYWLQTIAINVFGINEWGLRFWTVFFGVAGCLIVYIAGRSLFTRRAGMLSAIILASSPLYFGISHYATLDSELTTLVSGSLLFFLMALHTSSNKKRILLFLLSYVFCGLAVLTKGLIGIVIPAMIIGSWILILNRWQIFKNIHIILGICIIMLIAVPWYWLVQKANPQFFYFFVVLQQFSRFFSTANFNNETFFWFYFPVVALVFLPWTFFLLQAIYYYGRCIWKDKQKYRNELFLILWVCLILLFFSIPKSKTISRITPIMPALALIVGNYLSKDWKKVKFSGTHIGATLFIVFSSMASLFIVAILTHLISIKINPQYFTCLTITSITLFVAGIIVYYLFQTKQLSKIFYCIAMTAGILLLNLISNVTIFNTKTIKPLATFIQSEIKPNDEIITYLDYYHDLPFYTKQRITVVADWHADNIALQDNWRRELWFNMPYQDTSAWLIDEEHFWERWQSSKHLFVLLDEHSNKRFLKKLLKFCKNKNEKVNDAIMLGKYNNVILVTNMK